MEEYNLKINKAFFWVVIYFGIMLLYTFLDVVIWRKLFFDFSSWLNIITIVVCVCGFLILLRKTTGYRVKILENITPAGLLSAIACSALFYLILDTCLDPILESIFPISEQGYQETIKTLIKSPVTSFLQLCLIAPMIEEILMRGFILGGLRKTYGVRVALLVSAVLFALLHFNMVQTLSAFICAIILGLLYIKTNSILCCIIAHCGYNLISYIMMILPYAGK